MFLCEISQSLNVALEFKYLESYTDHRTQQCALHGLEKLHCLIVDLDHRLWLSDLLFLPIKRGFACLLCLSPMPAWSQKNEIM